MLPPNEAQHGPPVDSPHVFCHTSCTVIMLASRQARQKMCAKSGARKLER